MKKIILLLTLISFFKINAQEIKEQNIISSVSKATVFLKSAQVTRNKKVFLNKGIQLLKFTNLSPFIDKKSIQIKAKNTEIQSVNYQKNHKLLTQKSKKQIDLESKLKDIEQQLEEESINNKIISEEILFLKVNNDLKGNQTLTSSILSNAATFYSTKIKSLYKQEYTIKTKIKTLNKRKNTVLKQINNLSSIKEYPTGEIFIKVASSMAKTVAFELSYNVGNVSWFPTYDVKVKNINTPAKLVYKATVIQNSKVDWNNVKLRFSSATPSRSIKASNLKPYFLDYGSIPHTYNTFNGEVTGKVTDIAGNPITGVSVLVKGTSVGTLTDFEGNYKIKIPTNTNTLVFSYLGFKSETKSINNHVINVNLEESAEVLEEVVITGYQKSKKRKNIFVKGLKTYNQKEQKNDYSLPTQQIINQTSVSFEIIKPYTLKSGNKDYTIAMKTYNLEANYKYNSVPKINENVFLVASVKNWEQLNLLEGEANIYFEDTFIGASLIDNRFTEKELDISLGIDKNVTIKRKKLNDFTTRQFIGNKKQEKRTYEIVVKNNKQQSINIIIKDQIPISKREDISVTLEESSNGKLDKKTGEIKWNLQLNPKESKTMNLKYGVRFHKDLQLNLD